MVYELNKNFGALEFSVICKMLMVRFPELSFHLIWEFLYPSHLAFFLEILKYSGITYLLKVTRILVMEIL